mgnify:CR=1 FL=1
MVRICIERQWKMHILQFRTMVQFTIQMQYNDNGILRTVNNSSLLLLHLRREKEE